MEIPSWLRGVSLSNAAVSVVVSALVSYYSANLVDQNSKARTARLEELVRFTSNYDATLADVYSYIAAVAKDDGQKDAGDALSSQVNKLFVESDNILLYFDNKQIRQQVSDYQSDLKSFSSDLDKKPGSKDMVEWVEKFGRLNDANRSLTVALKKSIDIAL